MFVVSKQGSTSRLNALILLLQLGFPGYTNCAKAASFFEGIPFEDTFSKKIFKYVGRISRHDIQHNDTQHNRLICDTQHIRHSA
jgi:hypothetical protein